MCVSPAFARELCIRRVLTTTLLAAAWCPGFAQERTADDGWGLIVGAGAPVMEKLD
jgi:hypothetical protein